tara:strand:- start:63 stop:395 length:333 start_codon:yes stop_codon:yes gene_type:complete
MITFNLNNMPRGENIKGGFTPIRIIATALSFYLKGGKPPIHRKNPLEKGWFARLGNGGKSGEPLLRLNFGNSYSCFQAYNRNGYSRATQNKYVAHKRKANGTKLTQRLAS